MVSVADFDSLEIALQSGTSGDLLERQNELLHICSYLVWRKESSKSASYLLFHFFHGYTRSEVAEMARLPIAAIYNKLRDVRVEIKQHLQGSGKLRVLAKSNPPRCKALVTPLTSTELFTDLRNTIFAARVSECLPEEALLGHYRQANSIPLRCSLLAHIAGCERCLLLIDGRFQRPADRDRGPLDGIVAPGAQNGVAGGDGGAAYRSMMQVVRRRRAQVHEHRPGLLSIAVNGNVTAFHDIQGVRSSLSSRIDPSAVLSFVEVFSEQQVRLAQLAIGEPPHSLERTDTQRITLSDSRWLELTLRHDGVGLHAEAVYFDPALSVEAELAAAGEHSPAYEEVRAAEHFAAWRERLRRMLSPSALRWAVALVCLSSIGLYMAKHAPTEQLSSREVLDRAAAVETLNPLTEAEHQMLRIDRVAASGAFIGQGKLETWKDGSGRRYVRHLYSRDNQLLASEWQADDGKRFTIVARGSASLTAADRMLVESGLWKREISSKAFRASAIQNANVTTTASGYEVTSATVDRERPRILSESLILNREFHLSEERFIVREGASVSQVRFVQTMYRKVASSSIPDSVFRPDGSNGAYDRVKPLPQRGLAETLSRNDSNARLMQVHIAVLYALNQLGADVADPITVFRTPAYRIRLAGTVATEQRRTEIETSLRALPDRDLIENSLVSTQGLLGKRMPPTASSVPTTRVYAANAGEPAADGILRRHFEATGLTGSALDQAVLRFSADALKHAQRALQSAYALDRLCSVLDEGPTDTLDPATRREWADMVKVHSGTVREELQALRSQLQVISPAQQTSSDSESRLFEISNPAQFKAAATNLRKRVQAVNQQVGATFAGVSSENNSSDLMNLLDATQRNLPVSGAAELSRFAASLSQPERLHERAKDRQSPLAQQ